ncbi:MAG: hypothetical protein JXQ23_00200 [Clostridia bacterium]|nr:hypothetical protein [Clostridia bacterium]
MFVKYSNNPVIGRTEGTFYSIHAANPDLLKKDNLIMMYFRGQGVERYDQIGVCTVEEDKFDGIHFNHYENNPIIKITNDENAFDNQYILDPASVLFNNKVYLYYSGRSNKRGLSVGLAVSDDGFDFKKHAKPIIENAMVPEVVLHNKIIYLFYQRKIDQQFKIFVSESIDGLHFENEKLVFESTGDVSDFDGFSISTVRIIKEEEYYYMIYGGGNRFDDYPNGFGIARSTNLITWKRSGKNPILQRGEIGSFDEGAIWFGTPYLYNGTYYLWYEGTGSGKDNKEISEFIRNHDYGLYAKESFSQIGLATYKGKLSDFFD